MKVTVNDNNLNIRVGAPSLNAACSGYIKPGTTIEIDGQVYKGDLYNGIDTWVKDYAGNYYWSGGINSEIPFNEVDYGSFFKNIDEGLLNNQGQGVTVVIIDEGVNFNKGYFDINKTQTINIDSNPINSYHGNFIAGIIAGSKTILGISTAANIISLKYKSDNCTLTDLLQNLIKALNTVLNIEGPLVVNLSQGFSEAILGNNADEKNQIITLIQQITNQNNKFIICSGGDNGLISGTILFPANLDECLSVGCLNEFHKDIDVSPQLNILSPIVNFTSFNLDFSLIQDVGSSYATAVISSMVSCILTKNINSTIKNADLLQQLKQYSVNKTLFQFDDLQSFQFQIT